MIRRQLPKFTLLGSTLIAFKTMDSFSLKVDNGLVGDAILKSALGLIPFAGPLLTEAYSYRGQVKQKRLNQFIEKVSDVVREAGGIQEEDIDNIKSEEFGDLLESIVRRSIQTRSEEKLKRFAKILAGAISAPINSDYSETFLDLIAGLSEKQIEILAAHNKLGDFDQIMQQLSDLKNGIPKLEQEAGREHKRHSEGLANNWLPRKQDLEQAKQEYIRIQTIKNEADKVRSASYYGLPKGEYQFLIQDLYAKALLTDIGLGRIEVRPFQIMDVTDFGREFLVFVQITNTDKQE